MVTKLATLDGTWEMHPMLVLQRADIEDVEGETTLIHGYTLSFIDVIKLVEMIDDEPGIEEDGFKVNMGRGFEGDTNTIVEFPPGEPARNAVAALRWYATAMRNAGPMPATTTE
jgi:hypothetical protein